MAKYEQVLCKIVGRDDLGRVRSLEVVYDHEHVDVSDPGNREFLIFNIERGIMKAVNQRSPNKGNKGN